MTVSSIYLQKGDVNFADKHNSRNTEKEPSYLLEKQYRKTNDFVKIADAHTLYHEQLFIRQKSHARGRTPELKDVFYEAVVNLEEKHTLQDVQKVASHLKAVYGFQPCSIAIHRDEGYVDKITKEVKYNLHAHLTFLCMKDGISTKRKLNAKKLSEMQTEVANILGMKRGQEHSKAKRLDHQQYRAVKRAEEELMREDAKNFCKLHNEKINKLQSTMIQPLLKLSQELTEEKSQLETEKAELETKLEAEKKNVKTVYVDKPVPRVLTDDEIELLPRVVSLKKKLTELQQKVESLTQAQSQRELERQSATTVHNFEHKDSTVKPQTEVKQHKSDDELSLSEMISKYTSSSGTANRSETKTEDHEDKTYLVLGIGYMTAEQMRAEAQSDDIGHYTLDDFKRALTADEFNEVFDNHQSKNEHRDHLNAHRTMKR